MTKHVTILVPRANAILSSVVGPYKIFSAVNDFYTQSGRSTSPMFKIDLVGIHKESILYDGAFSIHSTATPEDIEKTDLIIIPAVLPQSVIQDVEANYDFIPWIQQQRLVHNAEIASLCMGAFFLAETGLVDGKQCATHWAGIELFKQRYPHIDVKPEKIVTDQEGIYSSGGAYSFLNLIVHLVQKYCGKEVAIYISKLFEIDIDRDNQNQFAIFMGQKEHSDTTIKEAQTYIEEHIDKKISVDALSEQLAVSRRNFIRRFKKATGNTPLEYIQRVKIEVAKNALESSPKTINEVMFSIGYSDTKAFRNLFKRHTGLTPVAYKQKYNRELVSY
ncbi:helix-turn-helix domain-containing protein [Hyunsoonleella sp. SJ7]|uniref:Helix-turn-helix domain-containing protein n=1 Tax=Hyunsoonleella aquatilis TaxID=2762758 RepID=A0A923HFS8_9FLAO|nr:helix-turn-helix domain-containing protein [Hyunsoonleella aquatilis]MBC3759463.1 helix-turn-helix domain-containing protein [Hyunsoonleella aquatilis]